MAGQSDSVLPLSVLASQSMQRMKLYPFQFEPTFRQYVWGGRRLGTTLNKPIGDADRYAESWEVVDHGQDQSIVANGELAGTALGVIARDYPDALYGRSMKDRIGPSSFPLLFKFLDAHRTLSVQVHPNDRQAALLTPPDLGKTEAWYVIDAKAGSKIFAGLNEGVERAQLERACETGAVEALLHSFEPKAGDCVCIPAGTVHAIGEGMLVAEIQQSSDTTYRLFDWNRVDSDGRPRQLHIRKALEVVNYEAGPIRPAVPQATDEAHRYNLVSCDKFVLDRVQSVSDVFVGGDDLFHIVAAVEGGAVLECERGTTTSLQFGTTVLIPAASGRVRVIPTSELTLLDAYVP